ncbi:HlyD family secretion protein [Vreelandella olivaria]|uniref:HlyD family secretion protein n=1 Tax=Vreelandella olivaria TaxID=390919 RepID=UPI00201E7B28
MAQRHKPGSVLIHQPWGYTAAAVLALVFSILVALYSYLGTYTRKSTSSGLLMPKHGLLRLTTNMTGRLEELRVVEGQLVEAGEVLFVISNERFGMSGGAGNIISEQLRQRKLLLERQQSLSYEKLNSQLIAYENRLQAIDSEVEQLVAELHLIERRTDLAEAQLERYRELMRSNYTSVVELQQAEVELLTLQGQQQTLRRSQSTLQRERVNVMAQRQEIELQHRVELADIENNISLIRQEQIENSIGVEQVVTAPFDGVVMGLNIHVGQQVNVGQPLASFIPNDVKLNAHVYVSARQAGFIQEGQNVLIRHAAYPYQKFGVTRGSVASVAMTPYAVQELPAHVATTLQQEITDVSNLFYQVNIDLESQYISVYGEPRKLQVGMLLEADILQDKRRLYEWVLEPVYSVLGKSDWQ